jgi:CelD/BcsL family acetyltransferase involved in cellulose biosynthesis
MRGGVRSSQSVAPKERKKERKKERETERFLATLGTTAFGPVEIREPHLN